MHSLLLALALAGSAPAADLTPGTWKLLYSRSSDSDLAVCIVKLEVNDSKWVASLVARNTQMGKVVIESTSLANGVLRINMIVSDDRVLFEGVVGDDPKLIRGSYGSDKRLATASLVPTTDTLIDRSTMIVPKEVPPPLKEYLALESERVKLMQTAYRATGEDRKRAFKLAAEQQAAMDARTQSLFEKIAAEHGRDPCLCDVGLNLLLQCYRVDAPAERLRYWTDTTLKAAERFGPRYHRHVLIRAAEYVARNRKASAIAADLAMQADRELGPDAPPAVQAQNLSILVATLNSAGRTTEAAPFAERLEKIEAKLDAEYLAAQPKWKIDPYNGKRPKENGRAVLVELFTGSDSQPCRAANAALDRFAEAYKPGEVIIIRHHLHVPTPDPLANPDTDSRYEYYTDAYPKSANNPPFLVINGQPRASLGGSIDDGKSKYDQARRTVDQLINQTTEVKMTLAAKREGDRIILNATATGLGEGTGNRRLLLALIEDSIRYQGAAGQRFHRQVVRAMLGGDEGIELTNDEEKHEVKVDLADLRKQLNKSLDDFTRERMPFLRPNRPMDFKKLSAVGWIQNKKTHVVVQSVQKEIAD